MRLITIPFSHYCEKARWAADWVGASYVEEAYLPGEHFLPVRRAGGKTVPLLVLRDGRTLVDSTDIVKYLDELEPGILLPHDPSERARAWELEDDFDRHLGIATRVWGYSKLLPNLRVMGQTVGTSLSPARRWSLMALMLLVRPLIRRSYRVNDANVARSLGVVRETFERVSLLLEANGSGYLVGGRPSMADLAFASLAAPMLFPPGHPHLVVPSGADSSGVGEIVEEMRRTPAGELVLRMYRDHRVGRPIGAQRADR